MTKTGVLQRENRATIPYIILIALVINTFYLRGFTPPVVEGVLPTASYLIPVLTSIACVYLLYRIVVSDLSVQDFRVERQIEIAVLALASFGAVSLVYNGIAYSLNQQIILFGLEFYLNLVLFVAVFALARTVEPRILLDSLFVAGIVFSVGILYLALFDVSSVRRVGTNELPIGVNHLAHALAASFIIGLCNLTYRRHNQVFTILGTTILLPAIFLTGTRSAFVGVLLALSVFLVLHRSKALLTTIAGAVGGLSLLGLLTTFVFDWSRGSQRYLLTEAWRSSLVGRIDRFADALSHIITDPATLLFGAGVHNYVPLTTGTVVIRGPHNIWLSVGLYLGIPAAIAFTLLSLLILFRLGIYSFANPVDNQTTVTIFLILIIVSTYAAVSGRMTRIFTIWVVLGLGLEQIRRQRRS